MDNSWNFECECVHHKKGYVLCETCEIMINDNNKTNDVFVNKVKRWNKSKPNINKQNTYKQTTKQPYIR